MRLAIADASAAVTGMIAGVLDAVPGWEIAWTVHDGEAAIERCRADPPDVLLLAIELPGADGVEVTRRILGERPCAIVLLVDGAREAVGPVFDALAAGALDRATTPWIGPDGCLQGTEDLVRKVRTAAAAISGKEGARPRERRSSTANGLPALVAIGASTGGPAAVATVLGAFPQQFAAAVIVIQHVDARFSANLATWLGKEIALPVRVARPGDRPSAGTVTLAGGDDDLIVRPDLTLAYVRPAAGEFFHPSVDVFFRSLVEHWPRPGVAALLTGMGRDGAEGLLALRRHGWRTLAQDEQSSAVYGMPKAAATLKAATDVLPVELIGAAIVRIMAGPSSLERGAR